MSEVEVSERNFTGNTTGIVLIFNTSNDRRYNISSVITVDITAKKNK